MGDLLAVRPEEKPMPSKWQRVADAIREQIRSGKLQPGQRLPSITELQKIYGVSYSPIRAAMLTLKAEGLVEGVPGEGVYVKERP